MIASVGLHIYQPAPQNRWPLHRNPASPVRKVPDIARNHDISWLCLWDVHGDSQLHSWDQRCSPKSNELKFPSACSEICSKPTNASRPQIKPTTKPLEPQHVLLMSLRAHNVQCHEANHAGVNKLTNTCAAARLHRGRDSHWQLPFHPFHPFPPNAFTP